MKYLVLVLLLSGCATYDIERCEDGVCSTVHIVSPRKFKTITVDYDGVAKTFLLTAGDVGTDSTAMQILANIILQQQQQSE